MPTPSLLPDGRSVAEEKLCGELAVSLGMEREKVEELLIEKMAVKV